MTATASQKNRRALILLGAAIVVYLAISQLALPAYDQLRAAPATANDKAQQLKKYKRELSHRGNYETLEADTRKKLQQLQERFFTNDTAGAAELQKTVEDSAGRTGITLSQRSTGQPKKVDDLVSEVSMSTSFDATMNQLVAFLTQLQTSPKAINVRVAQIDPIQVAFEAPKQGELKKSVRVNLTIAGEALNAVEQKGK
jgi:type II secretion system (T2SS) protein M